MILVLLELCIGDCWYQIGCHNWISYRGNYRADALREEKYVLNQRNIYLQQNSQT